MTPPAHLLSFVTSEPANMVSIHVDLPGLELLISQLESLRSQLQSNDCPHTHLTAYGIAGDQLTTTKLSDQAAEVHQVIHVKIYGWTEQWAVRHGLKPGQ